MLFLFTYFDIVYRRLFNIQVKSRRTTVVWVSKSFSFFSKILSFRLFYVKHPYFLFFFCIFLLVFTKKKTILNRRSKKIFFNNLQFLVDLLSFFSFLFRWWGWLYVFFPDSPVMMMMIAYIILLTRLKMTEENRKIHPPVTDQSINQSIDH